MLYIKFRILEIEKFVDFKKLYNHMCLVREPNYTEPKDDFKIDWNTATDAQIDDFFDENRPKKALFDALFPTYTHSLINNYFTSDDASKNILRDDLKVCFINYLEYGFEVYLDGLEVKNNEEVIIKISTGNYPFGGLERFFIALKSFKLIPFECFDGFNIFQFNWISQIDYEEIILEKETKEYLKK